MEHLRVALGLFRRIPVRQWPGARSCLGRARFIVEILSEELARRTREVLGESGFQSSRHGALIFGCK
jgi:hypothetical protein